MYTPLLALLLAIVVAGCGGDDAEPRAATATPTEAEPHAKAGYSEGVKRYYRGAHPPTGDGTHADVEAEYHQPPKPAQARVGETITLTGSNIGVRMDVTLERVKPSADQTQVRLRLENTGITVYEAPLRNAQLTYADGKPQAALTDRSCSRDFDTGYLRIDVSQTRTVCLLFPGGETPKRLQLALEVVPTDAGGIWLLDQPE